MLSNCLTLESLSSNLLLGSKVRNAPSVNFIITSVELPEL